MGNVGHRSPTSCEVLEDGKPSRIGECPKGTARHVRSELGPPAPRHVFRIRPRYIPGQFEIEPLAEQGAGGKDQTDARSRSGQLCQANAGPTFHTRLSQSDATSRLARAICGHPIRTTPLRKLPRSPTKSLWGTTMPPAGRSTSAEVHRTAEAAPGDSKFSERSSGVSDSKARSRGTVANAASRRGLRIEKSVASRASA